MQLIDSHIHLDFASFDRDRDVLIDAAYNAGIERFVVPATTPESWPGISALEQDSPHIFTAYGIHPYFAHLYTLDHCQALESWIESHRCVAIGEIGLDYYIQNCDRAHQMALFDAQLKIASAHQLPVILHARKSLDEMTKQLKVHGITRGIVHSFNGSEVQAMRLIEMGFKLGFGGAVTYDRARRLHHLIKTLPLESICLETDAPDQPSAGYRGQRNEPLALLEVLNTIAQLCDTQPEIIAQQTSDNTYAALNIC